MPTSAAATYKCVAGNGTTTDSDIQCAANAERVTPGPDSGGRELPAHGITVQAAAYASLRNGRSFDITLHVRTQCVPGSRACSLTCSNSLAGDPDFGQRKNCRISYQCDGGPARALTVQEGEIARLSCAADEADNSRPYPADHSTSNPTRAQAHANLEAAALECSSRKYNIWNEEQRGSHPTRDERIAKLIEFGNECRRPLGLPDMVNKVPPEPKPVLSGAAGAAAAATLQNLVKGNSVEKLRKYLSSPGADINARPGTDEALLDYAAEQNRPEIARYLVAHGARVDATQWEGPGRGLTALHRAAAADSADIAELLIAHGAEVNALGPLGVTPLILAASQGNIRTATVLLEHGANITVATGRRATALSEAAVRGHQDMVRLLVIHAPVPSQGNSTKRPCGANSKPSGSP
jgi:ankyrin repeat protein